MMTAGMPGPIIDFTAHIDAATAGFVGREWLDREVAAFVRREAPYAERVGPLLIIGEPGIGKTAYAGHLVRTQPSIYYFCSALHPAWLEPRRFARSLGQQLATRFA